MIWRNLNGLLLNSAALPLLIITAAIHPVQGATNSPVAMPEEVHAVLKQYCLPCHNAEKHKGDLDLERFKTREQVLSHPDIWTDVIEKIYLSEMPPKDKPQPPPAESSKLIEWVNAALDEAARANAGDPGPVVLRRLSNSEYTYTLRDLTGVGSLDPAREFPVDSASGEGFMNVGNSLVMSPSLLTKYFDAAKEIANHAMLLPDGIGFSPSTTTRDWSEEKLAAIRAFYARFTERGDGMAVNLQGIKFDTKDSGLLPLEKYLAATLTEREALKAGRKTTADVAKQTGLNAKFLDLLWLELNASTPSLVLDQVRARWRTAKPEEATDVARIIRNWQGALWRFTTVGHIGKRDGPTAWQVPVTPLASTRDFKMPLPAPDTNGVITLYLATSDAGDGSANDFAVWENPRLVAPGRADLPLRHLRTAYAAFNAKREKIFSNAADCLAAAEEVNEALDEAALNRLAKQHHVEPYALAAWLNCLGIGAGGVKIDSLITQKLEKLESYDFVKGWSATEALSVLANSSDQEVRVPGRMKAHSIAVHPSPSRRVVIGWRCTAATTLQITGNVQHAHPDCGNGVSWAVELRRAAQRQRLAGGALDKGGKTSFGPVEKITVRPGDFISLSIGPRNGDHSCDLTALEFNLTDGTHTWNLAKDISPNILASNPHADGAGTANVWHFFSEPDKEDGQPPLPTGSLLAKWQTSESKVERRGLAHQIQKLLVSGSEKLPTNSPDAALFRQLNSANGPLLASLLRESKTLGVEVAAKKSSKRTAALNWGVDPSLFGKADSTNLNLSVRAPSVVEVKLPAEFVAGCEFFATGTLDKAAGAEGSVQMQVLTTRPSSALGVVAGAARAQGDKKTWSDGERPVISDSPILVRDGSAARKRIEAELDQFRQLFPAAMCYTKIVPVDEVVTLTLYYREDDHLRRLMLDDAQAAELDKLWAELHYVSQDALKLVDAFEQLWQFATQDADPSAFTPMREPIRQRAEQFKKLLTETQPAHLDAVLKFAELAYRRPLTSGESAELRQLYDKLRREELPHDQAVRLTLARVLVSPAFLYRAEQPAPGNKPAPVNDWELATRLSYFLWSSAPDAELRSVAAHGELHQPDVLVQQARRMLRDSRVRRLATEFACVWLHIHAFDELNEKSERHFPNFTELRGPMYEEAIRFFTDAFQNDASVLSFFDANHTFLNEKLAAFYEIPGVKGDEWRRVDGVKQYGRGGILGLGATLAKQSGASRTSPILRGNWISEVLIGDKLPRPPKDVPRLPEDEAAENLTVRELVQKHSSDPRCAGCHVRIDGFGFALEGFDAIGRARTKDLGGRPIDVVAKVFDGTTVNGAAGLREYLLTNKRDAVLNQFCRKLLGYSLGRAVMLSDKPLLAEMQTQLRSHDFHFSTAVETIVRSKQFREIRGTETVGE